MQLTPHDGNCHHCLYRYLADQRLEKIYPEIKKQLIKTTSMLGDHLPPSIHCTSYQQIVKLSLQRDSNAEDCGDGCNLHV